MGVLFSLYLEKKTKTRPLWESAGSAHSHQDLSIKCVCGVMQTGDVLRTFVVLFSSVFTLFFFLFSAVLKEPCVSTVALKVHSLSDQSLQLINPLKRNHQYTFILPLNQCNSHRNCSTSRFMWVMMMMMKMMKGDVSHSNSVTHWHLSFVWLWVWDLPMRTEIWNITRLLFWSLSSTVCVQQDLSHEQRPQTIYCPSWLSRAEQDDGRAEKLKRLKLWLFEIKSAVIH